MTDPIQRYTDLTYGLLLLIGLIAVNFFGHKELFAGLGIGLFIGYVIHVGSEMVEFSKMQQSVESVEETMESVAESVEPIEQAAEKTVEKVEETREAVEKVDEKASRVEGAVNSKQLEE